MQPDVAELEDLAQFFDGRLRLIGPKNANALEDNGVKRIAWKQQRREEQKRKEAVKKHASRETFKPAAAAQTNTPTQTPKPPVVEGEMPQELILHEGTGGDESLEGEVDRECLKQKLREKIVGIREKSGSAKIKKKSVQERKNAQNAQKQKKQRRKLALQRQRHPEDSPVDTPPKKKRKRDVQQEVKEPLESLTFSEVKESEEQISTEKKRKHRMAQKFRQLGVAQKGKETAGHFTQTGEGGEKVLKMEWDRALLRASGQKVLDDPKRIQKSIDDTFKLKAKKAKKWQERWAQVEEQQEKRQEKREKNLQRRSEERKKKKEQRKAQKRGSTL